jgi:vacuolar-type H+-ATPase subunit B/Vma2
MQHVENLLRRYRGQLVNIKSCSGGVYEGEVAEITNDYVALKVTNGENGRDTVFVVIHTIESILPRGSAG